MGIKTQALNWSICHIISPPLPYFTCNLEILEVLIFVSRILIPFLEAYIVCNLVLLSEWEWFLNTMGLMIVKLKVNDSFLVLYFTKASYRILQIFIISCALRWLWVVIYYLYILLSVENAASSWDFYGIGLLTRCNCQHTHCNLLRFGNFKCY